MTCRMISRFISLLALLLVATPALAQSTPVIFTRTDIVFQPAPPATKEGEASILRPSATYNVEERSEDALSLEYIHTLNSLTDSTGVMIVFNEPAMVALPTMQVFTPVDTVFIAEDGTVLQMLPDVVLADVHQQIMAREPIKALLFLQAGQIKQRFLQPRDTVAGNMFTPEPAVMQ